MFDVQVERVNRNECPDSPVVSAHFTRLTGLFRNYNDAAPDPREARRLVDEINALDESAPMTARSA